MEGLILIGAEKAAARAKLLRSGTWLHEEPDALADLQPFERPDGPLATRSGLLTQQRRGSEECRCSKAQNRSGRTGPMAPHQLPRTARTASRSSEYDRGSSALNFMLRYFTRPSGPITYTVRRLYPPAS